MQHLTFILLCFCPCLCAELDPAQLVAQEQNTLRVFSEPRRTMAITSEVNGRLLAHSFDVGQVIPSQAKLQIDPRVARLEVQRLQAQHKRMEAEASGQKMLLDQSLKRKTHLEGEVTRQRKLLQGGGGTAQLLEQRQHELMVQIFQVELEKQRLEALGQAVAEQQHAVETQKVWLQRHDIALPLGWTIVEKSVEPGEWVTPGQTMLRCADLKTLRFSALLSEVEWSTLESPVTLRSPTDPKVQVKAKAYHAEPHVDDQTRRRRVWFEMPAAPHGPAREWEMVLASPRGDGAIAIPLDHLSSAFGQYWAHDSDGGKHPLRLIRLESERAIVERPSWPPKLRLVPPPASAP